MAGIYFKRPKLNAHKLSIPGHAGGAGSRAKALCPNRLGLNHRTDMGIFQSRIAVCLFSLGVRLL